MIERHLLKLRARDEVSAKEEEAICGALGDVKTYSADHTLIRQGELLAVSTLLLDGIMCRYKDLRDGKRQITELHVAGDFVDLHSFTLKRLDHNIMTLTPCRAVQVPHERLERITEQFPHLTRLYWFSTTVDAAIHREWELSLGRRTAVARLAALLCEMHLRLGVVGLVDGNRYALPLTQTDLAECLGLTSIHVNRTLKDLREQGIVEFRGGTVTIHDLDQLRDTAEFDPAYLYLEHRRH
ncbi:MAG TPA: Crp/Fnr family transcriptional regulator [Sphingomonas sp.]|nr:Crp/Fnr family transcriptional regulator [Sphingomonas sp.]